MKATEYIYCVCAHILLFMFFSLAELEIILFYENIIYSFFLCKKI